MKKGKSFVLGMLAAALTFGVISAGCDNGTTPSNEDPETRAFSVSGSFTNTGAGGGKVNFKLESDGSAAKAVAAGSYAVSGVLEDDDLTIRLKGSYDPNTGKWSVSAKSSAIIYTIDGKVNSAGVSQGCTATVVVKSGDEWVPYIFPITEETAVTISNEAGAEESLIGGFPSFALGYWNSNEDYGGGYVVSLSLLVSDWRAAVTGTLTSPEGTSPIGLSWTMLEYNELSSGTYELIACYPEYAMTVSNLAKAVADYLGLGESEITGLTEAPDNGNWPSGRWIYDAGNSSWWGGFSTAEFDKLNVFWATGGWEKWAAVNGVPKENRYVKAKMSYKNGNTKFDMINMVAVEDSLKPWSYTYSFPTLTALKAAYLVEEREWDWSGGSSPTGGDVIVTTFTR
jgi:hypothetical protein